MATRWHPDTCSCVIEFDGVDEQTDQLINPVAIKTCRKHADLPGQALAPIVRDHNGKKNNVLNALVKAGASLQAVSVTYDDQDNFVVRGAPAEAIEAVIADEKVPVISVDGDVEKAASGEATVVLTKG